MKVVKLSLLCAVTVLVSLATPAWSQGAQILPTVSLIAGTYKTTGFSGDGGPATSATFGAASLNMVSPDPFGNLYVTDTVNNVIRKIAPDGTITTVAGGATSGVCTAHVDAAGDGCLATQATLNAPVAARWHNGNLYIEDTGNSILRVVNGTTGIISVFAGTYSATAPSTTTDGAVATKVNLLSPQDFTWDPSGNMFLIVTGGQPWIVRIDAQTNMLIKYVGTGLGGGSGTGGPTGDGGPANVATLSAPSALATDAAGNLYIGTINNHTIRKVTPSPTDPANPSLAIISAYAAAVDGNTSVSCADGTVTTVQCVQLPEHMVMDAFSNLYVADAGPGTYGYSVRKIVPLPSGANGTIYTTVGNHKNTGPGDGLISTVASLVLPYDVELTPSGDMVIADRGADVIYAVRPAGTFLPSVVGTAATTQTVYALTQGASGTFTVTGSSDFTVSTTTCAASTAVNAVGTLCTATLHFTPTAVGKRAGTLVFMDAGNNVATTPLSGVGKGAAVSVLPGMISTIAGTGVVGPSGDNGSATAATLGLPGKIAVDASGNVFIADVGAEAVREVLASNGTIVRVAGNGTIGYSGDGSAAASASLNTPAGLAVDGSGNLFIADAGNNVVRRVNLTTGVISTFAGGAAAGCTTALNANGDGCLATQATLSNPSALALSNDGTVLYIADTGHAEVRAVGLRSSTISTFAGTGTQGATGDGGPATAATLYGPTGLAVGPANELYISDSGNNKVRVVASSGFISTFAGTGGAAAYSADGPASGVSFNFPTGIAAGSGGNVYIVDGGNHRIGVVSKGSFTTVAGIGTKEGSTGDGGLSNAALLSSPNDVALDASGNLYLADTGNYKVRKVTTSGVTIAFPQTSSNSTSSPISVALYNIGNQALNIASAPVPSPYTQATSGGTDCAASITVAAGTSCAFEITFAPQADNTYNESIVVTDNAQGQAAATQTINLTGVAAPTFSATFTTGLPANVVAGATQSVTVSVTSPGLTYTGTLHLASTDSAGTLAQTSYTFTAADNGSHTFTGIQFATGGTQTLTASDTVTVPSITATTSTAVIPAGGKIVASSGDKQSADIASGSFQPLAALVTDAQGTPLSGITITFTISNTSGPSATFATGTPTTFTTTTNSAGLATTPALTPNGVTGSFSVTASVPSLTSYVFTLSNTSSIPSTFTLTPANADYPGGVSLGGNGSETITLAAQGGFSGTVSLSCSVQQYAKCAISPTSILVSPTSSPTVTLTFTSTPSSSTGSLARRPGWLALMVLLGVGVFAFRRRKIGAIALALLLSMGAMSVSGCGSSSNSMSVAGIYPVTVTGTSGSVTASTLVVFNVGVN